MNLEIANRLTALRKQNGYSQEELADKLNVSRQAVSKWERGESSPDTDNLIALAKLYNVSLDELLGLSNNKENNIVDLEDEDEEDNEDDNKKGKMSVYDIINSFIPLFIVVLYLFLGAVFSLWHPGWILFICMPLLITLVEAIKTKRVAAFGFPLLVVVLYLIVGFEFSLWHPGWIMFLLIPVYYLIAEKIDKKNNK